MVNNQASTLADLSGKVAVVTGAASGIGYALAEMWLARGMRVVLADIEEEALARAAKQLGGAGEVLGVPTDVSRSESVEELKNQAEGLGRVAVVCNNAGVSGVGGGAAWEKPESEWQWVLGVNLWGVINGVLAFMPGMVARDEGHIVNTASVAGLLPLPFAAHYATSKHGIVGLSMSLHQELAAMGSHVHVSVLCPGWVRTNISESSRNWIDRFGRLPEQNSDQARMLQAMARSLVGSGMEASEVAEHVYSAVEADRFWVLPKAHEFSDAIKEVAAGAVAGRNPPIFRPA